MTERMSDEESIHAIENTDLYFFIQEHETTFIKGIIAWDEESPLYKVEIWWDGKIRLNVLRDDLNLSINESQMYIGDIVEISAIMEGIKKIENIYFPWFTLLPKCETNNIQ